MAKQGVFVLSAVAAGSCCCPSVPHSILLRLSLLTPPRMYIEALLQHFFPYMHIFGSTLQPLPGLSAPRGRAGHAGSCSCGIITSVVVHGNSSAAIRERRRAAAGSWDGGWDCIWAGQGRGLMCLPKDCGIVNAPVWKG